MKQWLAKMLGRGLTTGVAMAGVLGLLSGCGQRTFLSKEVFEDAHSALMPASLEERKPVISPLTEITGAPPTVYQPDRKPRYMSLQEAIAIALENGAPGNRTGVGSGTSDDTLATFTGPSSLNQQSDRIRVLALNPALAGAAIEAALSRFDALWVSSVSYTGTDGIPGVTNFPGFIGSVPGQTAQIQSSIVKLLPSGGIANVSLLTDYRNLNNSQNNPLTGNPLINPEYAVRLSFGIEQPLWRDWGTEINELVSRINPITGNSLSSNSAQIGFNAHQSALGSFSDRGQVEGILISRLRFDQNRTEFERNVSLLLLNSEVAYWNLYNAYGQLYSYEENVRILQKAWQESYNQWKSGRGDPAAYYQILGQYMEFRGNRVQAMQQLLDAERNLRGILGLKGEDGERIIPITPPSQIEMKPDWETCVHDALNLRPELLLARDNLKYHQYLLQIQKNNIKPDLRAFAKYEPFGNGSTLQGNGTFTDSSGTPEPTNALRSLGSGHLADWQAGVFLNIPLGARFEHASIRAARLELAQSYYFLRDQEERATRYLQNQYQSVAHWWNRIETHRAERLSYQQAMKTVAENIKAGKIILGDPKSSGIAVQALQIQRSYASALIKEYQAIATYNSSLANLEFAKGTLLRYNNVHINEGALPECVKERAVDYERDRAKALILCERPDSLSQPGRLVTVNEHDLFATPTIESEPSTSEKLAAPPRVLDDKTAPRDRKRNESWPAPAPGSLPELLPEDKNAKQSAPAGAPKPLPELLPSDLKKKEPGPAPKALPDLSPKENTSGEGPTLLPTSGTQKASAKGASTFDEPALMPQFRAAKDAPSVPPMTSIEMAPASMALPSPPAASVPAPVAVPFPGTAKSLPTSPPLVP